MRFIPALIAFAGAALATAAGASEQVEIKQGDTTLRAVLFRPAGPGPFPAVVALHGCSGLGDASGPITPRYRDWGDRLAGAGFAVLFPDSFSSRGLRTQCRVRERKVRASRERVDDANAARNWLQSQAWVTADRVSLIGWSNGATSTLWTVRPKTAKDEKENTPDFRSAIAFYPGCNRLDKSAWSARIPTLILVGALDDWTPAKPCQRMISGARGRSALATITTYPRAYHDFDRPNYPVRQRSGLAYTADGSGKAHLGTNNAARADAIKRVPEWLSR
jgi:dienelactone hydrolase